MEDLKRLPNIGKEMERQLNEVGVLTVADLRRLGSKEVWLKIQAIDSSACIHRLLALEGAILGVNKTLLPEDRKLELKEFYRQHRL